MGTIVDKVRGEVRHFLLVAFFFLISGGGSGGVKGEGVVSG